MTTQSVEQQIENLKTEVANINKHITELSHDLMDYVNASIKSKIDTLAVSVKSTDTTWTSGTLQGSMVSFPSSTLDFNPGKCSCCS